jgi:NADPH:quinone reductase-like Zn-dependent oxidoreductase
MTVPGSTLLGSDICRVVDEVGPGVSEFTPREAVFGVTNARFTGGYAEYAVARAGMMARKPETLLDVEAASVPVFAVTEVSQSTVGRGDPRRDVRPRRPIGETLPEVVCLP